MNVKSGYLELGRLWGAPIRLHWSLPLGALVFTGLRIAPGAWLGFALLILVHELGHALAVMGAGQRVVAVDVLGIGGLCRFEGHPTLGQRVLIAWAGVLAQAALGLATLAAWRFLGPPSSDFQADLVYAFTRTNLELILLNLLPVPPLDGVEAWGVLKLFRGARARRRTKAKLLRARIEQPRSIRDLSAAPPRLRPSVPRDPDELETGELPPMPDEVKHVLDRIMAEGRAQHEGEKKKQ